MFLLLTMLSCSKLSEKNCVTAPGDHILLGYYDDLTLMSAGFVLINKSAKLSDLAVCFGLAYQRGGYI